MVGVKQMWDVTMGAWQFDVGIPVLGFDGEKWCSFDP